MDCGATMPPNLESRANSFVPVQRIGVVHRHHPAADVGGAARIPQLPAADRLAHAVIDVGEVELGAVRFGGFLAHACSCLAVDVDDDAAAHLAFHQPSRRVDRLAQGDLLRDRIERGRVQIA